MKRSDPYVRIPEWLIEYLQREFPRSSAAWRLANFLVAATINWRHGGARVHRHRAQISEEEWLETGILDSHGKTLVLPVKFSRVTFWRVMRQWKADGIVFIERVGIPKQEIRGGWTPRQANVYGFVQESCVHCGQRVDQTTLIEPKPGR